MIFKNILIKKCIL